MKIIKKIFYYRDLIFFIRVFITSIKIFFIGSLRGFHSAISLLSSIKANRIKDVNADKIIRYVNLCSFIWKKLGIRYTCLTYSLLLCYMFRHAGLDAVINFGAKKKEKRGHGDSPLLGHCWVTIDKEEIYTPYKKIFKYP